MKPLAYRLRPTAFSHFVGQKHLLGPDSFLRKEIEKDRVTSMILYGPPGSGKTSLACIIAKKTKSEFRIVNAVSAGIKDLKEVINSAKKMQEGLFPEKTILFIDEIHRFNKAQQDFLLPFVEKGVVILVGATTENPSFEVIPPLLSRCQVYVLKSLDQEEIIEVLKQALQRDSYLKNLKISDDIFKLIARFSNGDARFALNMLEKLAEVHVQEKRPIGLDLAKEILQKRKLNYDKDGEEHYNIISAVHKSLRDSDADAAIYWIMRMLEGGEDPKYIIRRLIRFASEDIGNADPQALEIAIAGKEAVDFLGIPECDTALIQVAQYLAKAPKNNSCYVASKKARADVREFGNLPVPLHLRNPETKLMEEWGYGKGYKYAHDYGGKIEQEHFPEELKGKKYF